MNNGGNIHEQHTGNPDVTYERRDLSARGVIAFLIGLTLVVVLIQVVVWGMYQYLDRFQSRRQQPANPLATVHPKVSGPSSESVDQFPAPRLQPDPVAELNEFRAREDQILNSYGWVDQKAGVAHIPIDRAMDMLVARGLPTVKTPASIAATPNPSGGLVRPARKPPKVAR